MQQSETSNATDFLATPIEYLKGVGPQRAETLKKEIGIYFFGDLLYYYPFRYIDRTHFHTVKELSPDLPPVQLRGVIKTVSVIGQKRGQRLVATFKDDTGTVELVWFKGIKWLREKLVTNREYILFGKPSLFQNSINIAHPDLETLEEYNSSSQYALQGVYASTEKLKSKGLDHKGIWRLQKNLLSHPNLNIPETISPYILSNYKLPDKLSAMLSIHLPEGAKQLQIAQKRMKFEELFFIQIKIMMTRHRRYESLNGLVFKKVGDWFNKFYNEYLPFELTSAQKKVLKEIRTDLGSGKQMNRLLQGDVGSGKTIVAIMAMLIAMDNQFQAALMAPTEILAKQHAVSLTKLLSPLGVQIGLLTGTTKAKQKKSLLKALKENEINIVVGTHALLEDPVQFENLGLVIIDEQHRFGVAQRAKMWKKNTQPPHVLVMTATPIPRTLAMTVFGDLDVSVIDELPPGRKSIKTIHRYDSARLRVFGFMKEQIALGRQIYIVYPLINESETLDYKDLMDGFESIERAFPKPQFRVSIVHGQMKSEAKDDEMRQFIEGKTQILVATTVIEVGVDVPNASVMIIESAERFGLSQLHQLRGRVGRGSDQSYCLLMSGDELSREAKKRIKTMVSTNDGFKIAEVDLELRGPGDIGGTMQSGALNLKIADVVKDQNILAHARKTANAVIEMDSSLDLPKHENIRAEIIRHEKASENWSRIS